MPLHLLHLDFDRVKGVTEHLALFCYWSGLHDNPRVRNVVGSGYGTTVVDGRGEPTPQLR